MCKPEIPEKIVPCKTIGVICKTEDILSTAQRPAATWSGMAELAATISLIQHFASSVTTMQQTQ